MQTRTIAVEGRLVGNDGAYNAMAPTTLRLRNADGDLHPRIDSIDRREVMDLKRIELAATASTGLPFDEEFVLLSLSSSGVRPGDDYPPPYEATTAPGWLRAHIGDLAVLRLRKDDITLPQASFDAFVPLSLRPAGAAWFVRVEDDDRAIPWIIREERRNCLPLPLQASMVLPEPGDANDCFDVKSLAGMFLVQLAVQITESLDETDIPLTQITAMEHELHMVPHLSAGENMSGFGMIYAVRLRVAVGPVNVSAWVFVPLGVHFIPETATHTRTYEVRLDPFSTSPAGATWSNLDRVTVRAEAGSLENVVIMQIRQRVVSILEDFVPPNIELAGSELEFELVLENLFWGAATGDLLRGAVANFEVVAMPERRTTVTQTTQNRVLRLGPVVSSVGPAPEPPAPPGTLFTPGPGMALTITRRVDRAGALLRTTLVPPLEEGEPFVLYFLE